MRRTTTPAPGVRFLLGGIALGALGLGVAASAAASAVAVVMARKIITPPTEREHELRITAADDHTVTLSATRDSLTPGRYGLWFDAGRGHARIGDVLRSTPRTVTRALIAVDRGDLSRARYGRMSSWYYLDPRELGVPVEDVRIATPLGPAPAWVVPADGGVDRWVIQVHGRAVRRQETIRAVPAFRAAGWTSLLVSYRNDGDAPSSADGRYALGDAEWRDVDAAMRFAVEAGARELILMGWSMGGATVLQAATRSALAPLVRGVVLDSPVIDWVNVLDAQGRSSHVAPPVRRAAIRLLGGAWATRLTGLAEPIDLARLDFVRRAAELARPVLLLASRGDDYVPPGPAIALAAARPDIVDLELFDTARHVRLWNYDQERWTTAISRWLSRLPPAAR
jgi:alpha-beta hydrolase superfamily lysophospholipase